ncbi:hypothetical protein [Constantimarinum furrinae]|uniref:Uncharacterized protein n=1 Tax=Constantimarinum furrinae TaxID=2562285 RepID=A0A7G8PT82_9FLAO|nr:hypothetical protein [Constantimarinum furrinae]QNJ97548.1 hypothetical protein ALE3EI_0974 [Constantimarinum furrinae]
MKRKLRIQIQELAQQIIANNNTKSTTQLKQIAADLHEKLAVLEYLETQIEGTSEAEETALDSKSFREENWFTEPEPVPQPHNKEELVEPLMEKIKDLVAQMPEESSRVDELLEEVLPQKKVPRNDLEEFASNYQQTPTFERKEPSKGGKIPESTTDLIADIGAESNKPRSLNDKNHQGLNIGLNDRLAFIKHLFDGNAEDYTRVLSQISTMNSYEEAAGFIKGKVKPDYNYWLKKEEYSERFMAIVEKNFN